MSKGISVYPGLNNTLQENLDYIKYAKESGFSNIFTSLHIPEANYKQAISEFKILVDLAANLSMNVIADISPRTFSYLGCDMNNLKVLKEMGLYGIRVDFGFSARQIGEFTRNPYGMKIEINASTVTEGFLSELQAEGKPDYSKMQACHNYYPRMNTGISIETLEHKNRLLKKHGIGFISAFIPSRVKRRGPIFEGLPTIERHRHLNPQISAKHLFAMGIDNVIFGDSIPNREEIDSVGKLNDKLIELRVNTIKPNSVERNIMFGGIHMNRSDCAEDVVRSTKSRERLLDAGIILPHDNIDRKIGSVTIDNKDYARYCGELQICKKDLPADKRVNVVGSVIDDEIFIIDYINEETAFKLIEYCK